MDFYKLYEKAVQDPSFEIDFINEKFRKIHGKSPLSLREDFCGTGWLCCEWVKQGPLHVAEGVDLDRRPIDSGKKRHLATLTPDQKKRVRYSVKNVLHLHPKPVDVVVAFNFSYWVFRKRTELLAYFQRVRKSLKKDGVFFMDFMGGTEVAHCVTESKKIGEYRYYWECVSYNPIQGCAHYAIHFKKKGGEKKRAFTYEWRLWGLNELRDLLQEAGFSDVRVYWEGDDGEGGGNGIFTESLEEEDCLLWIAYLVVLP